MIELIGLWLLAAVLNLDFESKIIVFSYLILATGFRLVHHVAGGKRDE